MDIQNTTLLSSPCSTKDAVPATAARIRTSGSRWSIAILQDLSTFCCGKWTTWGCNEDSHSCMLRILKDSLDLGHYPGIQYCSGVIFAGRKDSLPLPLGLTYNDSLFHSKEQHASFHIKDVTLPAVDPGSRDKATRCVCRHSGPREIWALTKCPFKTWPQMSFNQKSQWRWLEGFGYQRVLTLKQSLKWPSSSFPHSIVWSKWPWERPGQIPGKYICVVGSLGIWPLL